MSIKIKNGQVSYSSNSGKSQTREQYSADRDRDILAKIERLKVDPRYGPGEDAGRAAAIAREMSHLGNMRTDASRVSNLQAEKAASPPSLSGQLGAANTNQFNSNTGAKLNPGESYQNAQGQTITQGTPFQPSPVSNQMGAIGGGGSNQTLTQGQSFTDPSGRTGIVNFDTNTGQRLSQGGTTNSNPGAQLGAISGTSGNPATNSSSQNSNPMGMPGSSGGSSGSNSGTSALEGQYQSLLGQSSDEQKAQKAIDDQNNATRTGVHNVQDQPIAMSFISGQQSSLENRNTDLQIPLQQRLANAQQKRQASLDAVKFQLDRADKSQARSDSLSQNASDNAYRQQTLAAQIANNNADNARLGSSSNAPSQADINRNQANDIASAVTNWAALIQKNGWRGVDPTQYAQVSAILKSEYGASAVLALKKAIEDYGLSVDDSQTGY